ncbi:MAG: long-chain fatty acid--CoA ligase, partial [Pseudomonadota bacterium]
GEKHALMGQIVVAVVKLFKQEHLSDLKKRMRLLLKNKLENYKIPQKIIISESLTLHNQRFKKVRQEIE